MALTVFAESMGLFHKGSGGKGIAPLDFCLSPPPPPAGPIPIPYVNLVQASDLSKGSKTVKIDGEPTALEDASYVSTSTGDEMGTQGGSVITAKTKGKGYFALWSFTVQIEGKGVCRHGDPMGQNCASMPFACFDFAAIVSFNAGVSQGDNQKPCKEKYSKSKRVETTPEQRRNAQNGNCWQCNRSSQDVRADAEKLIRSGASKTKALAALVSRERNPMEADHQPPLKVAWHMGGCRMEGFKKWAQDKQTTRSHCYFCSRAQSSVVRSMKPDDIAALSKRANSKDMKRLREIDSKISKSPHRKNLLKERDHILAKFKL